MKEKTLLKYCIILSIVGLSILFIGTNSTEAKKIDIKDIEKNNIGDFVSITGTVKSKYYNGEHMFFDLEESDKKIHVVFFKNTIEKNKINPEEIRNGDIIRVTGKIDIYKNKLEVIGQNIN